MVRLPPESSSARIHTILLNTVFHKPTDHHTGHAPLSLTPVNAFENAQLLLQLKMKPEAHILEMLLSAADLHKIGILCNYVL